MTHNHSTAIDQRGLAMSEPTATATAPADPIAEVARVHAALAEVLAAIGADKILVWPLHQYWYLARDAHGAQRNHDEDLYVLHHHTYDPIEKRCALCRDLFDENATYPCPEVASIFRRRGVQWQA